jgi:hypothetical protein
MLSDSGVTRGRPRAATHWTVTLALSHTDVRR